jgi:uncharacterized protein YjiS (DUF1127 family)
MSRALVHLDPATGLADAATAPGFWRRLGRAAALPFAALAEAIRIRRELTMLAELDERLLADLGLPPEAVARVVATRRRFDPFSESWR